MLFNWRLPRGMKAEKALWRRAKLLGPSLRLAEDVFAAGCDGDRDCKEGTAEFVAKYPGLEIGKQIIIVFIRVGDSFGNRHAVRDSLPASCGTASRGFRNWT